MTGHVQPAADAGERGSLGTLGMIGVGFFWVSGGLFGNEILVASAPPGVIMVAVILVALVYAVPTALVSAELSTAIPEDGGSIVWAERAFGFTFAMHNAWWTYVSFIFDCSLYPVLASDYILAGGMLECPDYELVTCHATEQTNTDDDVFVNPQRSLTAMVFVFLISLVKLGGMEIIVKLSTVMSILSLLPCVIWICASIGDLDFGAIFRMGGQQETNWPLLFSFILWLNIGWIGLGALAGQVSDPARIYPRATSALFLISMAVNIIPIMISVSQHNESCDPTMSLFTPGFFGVLAGQKCGCWLHVGFKIGAILANVGLYVAQIMITEFTMVYLLESLFPEWSQQREESGEWLWIKQDGIAPAHVLSNAAIVMVLVWIPATSLVECSSLLGAITILVVLASFFWLRIQDAALERP